MNDVLDRVREGSDAVVYRVDGVGVVAPESCGALPGGLDPLSGVNSEISESMQTLYARELYVDGSSDLALLASEKSESARCNRDLWPSLRSVSIEPTLPSGPWVSVGLGLLAVSANDSRWVVPREDSERDLKDVLVGVRSVSDDSDALTNVVAGVVSKISLSPTGVA